MSKVSMAAILFFVLAGASLLQAADPTVINVSDTPVRQDIKRIGLNLGGDATWSGSILMKERVRDGGFEGIEYRTLRRMCGGEGDSFYAYDPYYTWAPVLEGAKYLILDGPDKGKEGKIVKVTREKWDKTRDQKYRGQDISRYQVTNPGLKQPDKDFVMLTDLTNDVGYIGQHGAGYWVFLEGSAKVVTEMNDNPPGSRGRHVATLNAGDGKVELSTSIMDRNWANPDGRWVLELWAKGEGKLAAALEGWKLSAQTPGFVRHDIPLSSNWERHKIVFDVKDYPNDSFCLHFELTSGKCKLDEISFQREGDDNPTAFRDPVVKQLKKFNPGSLRLLQMGGGSMDNFLQSRCNRKAYAAPRTVDPVSTNYWPPHPNANSSAELYSYGLTEFLGLCQEIKADPWVCVPGLIYQQEVADLVEYLAGPATTKYGRLRVEQGQEAPWTDVFDNIYIEFGNEAWNWSADYHSRGYNGPEYWHDLIAAGKKAPFYNPKIKFQIAGQAVNSGLNEYIAKDKTNADGFSVAPYIIHEMSAGQEGMPDEEFWSWVFGYPYFHATQGFMAANYKGVTEKLGLELSVYEVNHHVTGGDASERGRNRINASIAGGLNVANEMMLMLARQNVRVQNLFTFIQNSYLNQQKQNVKLWGCCLNMEEGKERYRPTFLATMLLNKVLDGDLLAVDIAGANPKWTCTAQYDSGGKGNGPFDVPCIHGYATRNGKTRGVILFNLHRTDALPVQVDFTGKVKPGSAVLWKLVADKIDADNEPDHEPQVHVAEENLETLGTGNTFALAPFSLTVIRWEEE